MYDAFSSDYDRFVNWESRLAAELPFLETRLQLLSRTAPALPLKILDAACGTGRHAIALAQRGYLVAGADLSEGMISQARQNAAAAGLKIRFDTAGFGNLATSFGENQFDLLLCLGNSLPHLLSAQELADALNDFARCLRPGGELILQNRNFDAVLNRKERWMEPQSHRQGSAEWIFLRFYDFEPGGLINFNIITLKRRADAPWSQQVASTSLKPWTQADLQQALKDASFTEITSYGSMNGEPFDREKSGNLVITARR